MDTIEDKFVELLELISCKNKPVTSALTGVIYQKLVASECVLIQAYEHSVNKSGQPVNEISCSPIGGYPELGPVLHWLNYPSDKWASTIKVVVAVLQVIEGGTLPKSQIDSELYSDIVTQAQSDGVIAGDGTIYGESKYEQLDQGWLLSLFYFLYYQYNTSKVHPFGDAPNYSAIALAANESNQVTIAIIGDWGTGEFGANGGPAQAVIRAVESQSPDYIIHLGDVYYAGTEDFPYEESLNLVGMWPPSRSPNGSKPNTSFTLNSNHEMYDGANGYFDVALGADETPFDLQKGHSYFGLTFSNWVILGLDSGYFADPSTLFMNGSIGGDSGVQATWVKDQFGDLAGKKVIAMTHHTGISNTNDPSEPFTVEAPLWSEVSGLVDGGPDYWYWGHLHNGIAYKENVLPQTGSTKMRCVGHGAIPYAEAWGLEPEQWSNYLDYYSQTPETTGKPRVRNGFALITLGENDYISETFYEVEDGTSTPIQVWPTT